MPRGPISYHLSNLLNTHIDPQSLTIQILLFSLLSNCLYTRIVLDYIYSFLPHVACHSAIPLYKYLHWRSNKFQLHFANPFPNHPHTDLHLNSDTSHALS